MNEIVQSGGTPIDNPWRGFSLGGETSLPRVEKKEPETSPLELKGRVNDTLNIYRDRWPHQDPNISATPIITLDTGEHLIVSAKINHRQAYREDPIIAMVDPDRKVSRPILDFTGGQIVDGAGQKIVDQGGLGRVVELLNEIDIAAYQRLTKELNGKYPVVNILDPEADIKPEALIGLIEVTSTPRRNTYTGTIARSTSAIGEGVTFSGALENAIQHLKSSLGRIEGDTTLTVAQLTVGEGLKEVEVDDNMTTILARLSQESPVGSIANPRAIE